MYSVESMCKSSKMINCLQPPLILLQLKHGHTVTSNWENLMQCASVHMVCICRFLYEHLTFQRKTYSLLSIELIDIFFLGQLFTSFSNNPRII